MRKCVFKSTVSGPSYVTVKMHFTEVRGLSIYSFVSSRAYVLDSFFDQDYFPQHICLLVYLL